MHLSSSVAVVLIISMVATTIASSSSLNKLRSTPREESDESNKSQTGNTNTNSNSNRDFAPKLIHQPQSVQLEPNEPHTIECPVESRPESQIKWFKDDQLLASEPPILEQIGRELMFLSIEQHHVGRYHCQASNYLGQVTSGRFKLSIKSDSNGPSQEPKVILEPQLVEVKSNQRAEFTCSLPLLQRNTPRAADISWRRNGKPLNVRWLQTDSSQSLAKGSSDETENSDTLATNRFLARQESHNQFMLTITKLQSRDDNSNFSCSLASSWLATNNQRPNQEELEGEEQIESNYAKLRVIPAPTPTKLDANQIPMDVSLAEAIDDLASRQPPNELENSTKIKHSDATGGYSLVSIARDLYELAKPTLVFIGLISLVGVVVGLQLVLIRRRNRDNRYMKHQYSSGSSSGGGSGTGSAAAALDCDPVLTSLLHQTLSVPNVAKTKKYRSYRDHMRKVAATGDLVAPNADLIDGYLTNANCMTQEPFSLTSALPNLYNQSLAAREQARGLLQSGEQHMRSLSNLSQQQLANQQQKHQQNNLRFNQNGNRLNMPLSFAFNTNTNQLEHANRLLDGPKQLMVATSAIWPNQPNLNQQQTRGQNMTSDEHYQLVSCASVSPSSSSADSHSSSRPNNDLMMNSRPENIHSRAHNISHLSQARDSNSLNHYSTIETNDEEDKYEELDRRGPMRCSSRSRLTGEPNTRTSTFVSSTDNQTTARSTLRSSFMSNSSGRGSGNSNNLETSDSNPHTAAPSLIGDSFARFGLKRNQRNDQKASHRQTNQYQDQLSPYAVSSICNSNNRPSSPDPIASQEAMRALSEQLDMNHLMLLDDEGSMPFNPPPPPSNPDSNGSSEVTSK